MPLTSKKKKRRALDDNSLDLTTNLSRTKNNGLKKRSYSDDDLSKNRIRDKDLIRDFDSNNNSSNGNTTLKSTIDDNTPDSIPTIKRRQSTTSLPDATTPLKTKKKTKSFEDGDSPADGSLYSNLSKDTESILKFVHEQESLSLDRFLESEDGLETQSSSYNQDQKTWTKLPSEVEALLKDLSAEVNKKGQSGLDEYLKELLDNVFADDDSGRISLEMLNDIYFIARDRSEDGDNPLLNEKTLIGELSDSLIKQLQRLDKLRPFIDSASAFGYRGYLMRNMSDSAKTFNMLDQAIYSKYDTKLNAVSFVKKNDENDELTEKIRDHRLKAMDTLETALAAVESEFKSKVFKKDKHKNVRTAQKKLSEAIKRVRQILDSDAITQDNGSNALRKLDLALSAMQAAAQYYIATSRHEKRLNSTQGVLDAIDVLLMPDDRIINAVVAGAFDTFNALRQRLVDGGAAADLKEYDSIVEELFFGNASESALLEKVSKFQKLLDRLKAKEVLGTNASTLVAAVNLSTAPAAKIDKIDDGDAGKLGDVNSDFAKAALVSGLVADAYSAYDLIAKLRKANNRKKTDALKGAQIATSTLKNSARLASNVLGAEPISAATGGVAAAALGAGVTTQKGITIIKTNIKLSASKSIEDPEIQKRLRDRLLKKRNRALAAALGGTLGIVGGTLAIIATAGAATPLVVGAGVGIAASVTTGSSAGIGVGLTAKKVYNRKKKGDSVGEERNAFGREIFKYMSDLIANGEREKAMNVARALTNNKYGQFVIMRGVEGDVDQNYANASLALIQEKLKTW